MMRIANEIILLAFVVHSHLTEVAANHIGDAPDVIDKCVHHFFNRALKASPLFQVGVDGTTLAKPSISGQNVVPRGARPLLSHPHSTSHWATYMHPMFPTISHRFRLFPTVAPTKKSLNAERSSQYIPRTYEFEKKERLPVADMPGQEELTENITKLSEEIEALLSQNKAKEVLRIDLKGRSSFADWFVIASGVTRKHLIMLAFETEKLCKRHYFPGKSPPRLKNPTVKGLKQGADWILMDTGDIFIHLFRPEVRSFYNLEELWEADLSFDDYVEVFADDPAIKTPTAGKFPDNPNPESEGD